MLIEKVFYEVVHNFLTAGIILGAFIFGQIVAKNYKPKWKSCVWAFWWILVLSAVVWATYGTGYEDIDPLFGYVEEQVEEIEIKGLKVYTNQPPSLEIKRNEFGLKTFFTLLLPALYGIKRFDKNLGISIFGRKII